MQLLNVGEWNVWAVLSAAVASFVIGGIWYAVLFRKIWVTAYRLSKEEVDNLSKCVGWTMPVMFCCEVLAAAGVEAFVVGVGANTAFAGALIGTVAWLGILAPLGFANHIGGGRPVAGFAVDAGKHLVSLAVVGMILGAWR